MTIEELFLQAFGRGPEATAMAPGRVNTLGEHTDYSEGFVLPTALDLSTQVAVGQSDDGAFHLLSQDVGSADARVDYKDGETPPPGYGRYVHGCIEVLRRRGHGIRPCRVAIRSTVPIGAGLSSSAALEVAVIRALRTRYAFQCSDVTVARLAQRAEIEYAGVLCGIMDQMAVSVGVPGQLLFLDTRSLESRLVPFPVGSEIAILDSGVPRTLATSGYNERRRECEQAAQALGVSSLRDVTDPARVETLPSPLRERARHVVRENLRVVKAASPGIDAAAFGRLMNESHRSLRDDFHVSVPALDALVECVMEQADAYGCKLTGAGFGGACIALLAAGEGERIKHDALAAFARRGYRGKVLV